MRLIQKQIWKIRLEKGFNDLGKIPLAPMGLLTPGSAHAWPSARPPINTIRIFPAHLSSKSPLKNLPNPSEVIPKVLEPTTTFEMPHLCLVKYSIVRWEAGGPGIFVVEWNPNILWIRSRWKISEPKDNFWNSPPFFSVGGRGVPEYFFLSAILKFWWIKSSCKISEP